MDDGLRISGRLGSRPVVFAKRREAILCVSRLRRMMLLAGCFRLPTCANAFAQPMYQPKQPSHQFRCLT